MSFLEVLYEDNHLLIVNKPAGLLTQPSGTDQDSLEAQAKTWIKEKYQKPGKVFLEAVHRLDKPVSGIVVFGRTSKALSRLNESMREKQSRKIYYAIVESIPKEDKATLEHFMVHDDYVAKIVKKEHPGAKLARLHYKVLKKMDHKALLEVELETGRYHQIRLQLSTMGCPIVGDKKYGAKDSLFQGIALHHGRLEIVHPTKNEMLVVEAPLPDYFSL